MATATRSKNHRRAKRNRRRAEIHEQVADLQMELARLALESAEEDEDPPKANNHPQGGTTTPPDTTAPTQCDNATPGVATMEFDSQGRPWRRNDRVRVTISGPHYGRVGRLDEPRKDTFWWMVLDPLPGKTEVERIYKKPTSFQRE